MAGYSGKNVSRDFWRFTSIPVATCLNLISLRLCFPVWVLLSFGEVLINSIVLSLCLPRAFYCVNVSVCKERVTLKVPLKSKTISGGYELANVEVVDPISMVSYLWNDIGIRIGQDEVEQYWTTIESLVPAGLCIQGLPARLCHWACMGIQLKFGRPTWGSRKWWEFFELSTVSSPFLPLCQMATICLPRRAFVCQPQLGLCVWFSDLVAQPTFYWTLSCSRFQRCGLVNEGGADGREMDL